MGFLTHNIQCLKVPWKTTKYSYTFQHSWWFGIFLVILISRLSVSISISLYPRPKAIDLLFYFLVYVFFSGGNYLFIIIMVPNKITRNIDPNWSHTSESKLKAQEENKIFLWDCLVIVKLLFILLFVVVIMQHTF